MRARPAVGWVEINLALPPWAQSGADVVFGGNPDLLQSDEAKYAVTDAVSLAVTSAPSWRALILDREISAASDQ